MKWWLGWWLNRRSLWYAYLFITTTLNTMSPLSNCSLSSSLSCLWTILTVPASPEVLSLSRCWTAKSSSSKHVKPSVVWRMNDAICVSIVIDVNGRSLWCRKKICRYRLWRIAAATFRGVLCIGITQLQRSTTLCIGYTLLQLLETRKLWIVWLILTFVRQSIHVTRRGVFPIPWEKSDRGFKVERLEYFLEKSGGILTIFGWNRGRLRLGNCDVFETCFVLISRMCYIIRTVDQ